MRRLFPLFQSFKEGFDLQYEIKEVTIKNKEHVRKRHVIEFKNDAYQLLSPLLMLDAPLLNWRLLDEVEALLAGEKERLDFTGNRTTVTATKEEAKIEDSLGELDPSSQLPTVWIKTEELYDLLTFWRSKTSS